VQAALSTSEVIQLRKDHIGPNAALMYAQPLHVVRGEGTYLYDNEGNRYLDCVNNVAHVGHCHPKVGCHGGRPSCTFMLETAGTSATDTVTCAACPMDDRIPGTRSFHCCVEEAASQPIWLPRCCWWVASEHRFWIRCVMAGDGHWQVAGAVAQQLATLNTNSRYLHSNLVRHAEALTATMPEPLSVMYPVCSGSEANDLALRVARANTDGARPGARQPRLTPGAPVNAALAPWLAVGARKVRAA
jgi:hypothetical protein